MAGGQTRDTEEANTRRQFDYSAICPQALTGFVDSFRRTGYGNPCCDAPPDLCLPCRSIAKRFTFTIGVLTLPPRMDHFRSEQGISIEESREMRRRGEAASLPRAIGGLVRAADVSGEGLEPLIVEVLVDHLEHRPDEALSQPWIFLGIDAAGSGHGITGQSARRREAYVGADPVPASLASAKATGQPLRQPAFHAPGMDRDYLRGKWIG